MIFNIHTRIVTIQNDSMRKKESIEILMNIKMKLKPRLDENMD